MRLSCSEPLRSHLCRRNSMLFYCKSFSNLSLFSLIAVSALHCLYFIEYLIFVPMYFCIAVNNSQSLWRCLIEIRLLDNMVYPKVVPSYSGYPEQCISDISLATLVPFNPQHTTYSTLTWVNCVSNLSYLTTLRLFSPQPKIHYILCRWKLQKPW